MSGASLAVLSLGVPSFARATSAKPAFPANFVGASTAVDLGSMILVDDLDSAVSAVGGSVAGPSLLKPEQNHLPPLFGPGVVHTGVVSANSTNHATNSSRIRTSRTD